MNTPSKKVLFALLGIVLGLFSSQAARGQAALDSNGTTVYNTRSDANAHFRLCFFVYAMYDSSTAQHTTTGYVLSDWTTTGHDLAPAGQSGDSIDFSSYLAAAVAYLCQQDATDHDYGEVYEVQEWSSTLAFWVDNYDY